MQFFYLFTACAAGGEDLFSFICRTALKTSQWMRVILRSIEVLDWGQWTEALCWITGTFSTLWSQNEILQPSVEIQHTKNLILHTDCPVYVRAGEALRNTNDNTFWRQPAQICFSFSFLPEALRTYSDNTQKLIYISVSPNNTAYCV